MLPYIQTSQSANYRTTRRMAITNGTCVSFCNQPKAHFGLPWIRPWDNRGKCRMMKKREDSMLVKCISACTHLSSKFNRFPVIQPISSKVRHFRTFFAHIGLPWVRPWDNCGKCYMDGKRIKCWSNA